MSDLMDRTPERQTSLTPADANLLAWAETLPPRIRSKINIDPEGCWWFTASVGTHGYGALWDAEQGRVTTAHRLVFELYTGQPLDRLPLDHLCRNRLCVRPDHLEQVTDAENIARAQVTSLAGTCRSGLHEWMPGSVYVYPSGKRACRACRAAARRSFRERTGK